MGKPTVHFPKPGTRVTYREAMEAYDGLEERILRLVFEPGFAQSAGAYDLLQTIEGVAEKYGLSGAEKMARARGSLRGFVCEKTSLANGANGERFPLMESPEELGEFDRTHRFEVGVDAEALVGNLESAIALIGGEADRFDEYADVYSANPVTAHQIVRESRRREGDKADRWFARAMVAAMCCLAVVCALHSAWEVAMIARLLG
ncbi:hypothetical protein [Enteroscipio rubneri]|uniref:hypothetical protein n=1 Tax=Enteroscipio rubneri TaxID=2070686 RepID=UPI003AF1765A